MHSTWLANRSVPFVLSSLLGRIAPPFGRFWIDFHAPNHLGLYAWGVLVESLADDGPDEMWGRWTLSATIVVEQRKGHPFGAIIHFIVPVSDDGSMRVGQIAEDLIGAPASSAVLSDESADEDVQLWVDEFKPYLMAALLTISFMHCKNVDLVEVDPPERVSQRHRRRHGFPLARYHTLNIDPMRRALARDGHADTEGLATALHICRGHFKTFTGEAPLFGKLTGTYWWTDHVRGDPSEGEVAKDYRIRIPSEGLGRTYEPADETPPAAPRQVGSDPDLSGRGRCAHNATQNAMAAALTAAGYRPLSPRPEDPQFDVAWVTDSEVWVCEVKSLTPQNEMSQMHRAIGQIIDYAHRLDDDRPIRKMIALETQPQSDHWVAERALQDIVLVWPEGFATALAEEVGAG